jgi:hypothetical protein
VIKPHMASLSLAQGVPMILGDTLTHWST